METILWTPCQDLWELGGQVSRYSLKTLTVIPTMLLGEIQKSYFKIIYQFERESNKERDGEKEKMGIFCLLVWYPNGHNSQVWAKLKSGTPSCTQAARVRALGPSSTPFWGSSVGTWIRSGVPRTQNCAAVCGTGVAAVASLTAPQGQPQE